MKRVRRPAPRRRPVAWLDRAATRLLDASHDAVFAWDPRHGIRYWNRGAEALYGYSARDARGRIVHDLLQTELPLTRDAIEKTLRTAGHWHGELHHTTRGGRRLAVESRMTLVKVGRASVVLQTSRDVTCERPADVATGLFTREENVGTLFGWPIENEVGSQAAAFRFMHPDDRERVEAVYKDALTSHDGVSVEFRVLPPSGGVRWLRTVATTARNGPGQVPHLLGVTTDITRQRLLEAQLHQAQKMQAIGQLAGGVAHDFNNLLTAILGYSRFLSEGLTDDEQRRDVEEIIKAADRAAGLTKQLLAFSRQQVREMRVLDVNEVIRDLAPMLRRLIGAHIELATLLTDEPAMVRADRSQLEQVLLNLAVNARDAMPDGGRLSVETDVVVFDELSGVGKRPIGPGAYVMIAVGDTGSGMSDEVKGRLFEPFFTTKEPGQGAGMGLATVYGIVTQSGGEVWSDSELGSGTTFKVYLPCAAADRAALADVPAVTPTGAETILLVEDEDAVRSLARMILQRAGYRVHAAANPADAERLFDELESEIDAVVSDVIMPGGTGPKLFARFVARKPTLKVLYISGYTDSVALDGGIAGANPAFVQKPFSADELIRRLHEVLQGGH